MVRGADVVAISAVVLMACSSVGPDTAGTAQVSTDATTTVAPPASVPTVAISVVVGDSDSSNRIERAALGARLTVTLSNPGSRDEFHLHGYDISTGSVEAGEEASISFTADKAGTFEIESHETDEVLVKLEIG